jgi:ABC-type multidrug transport system fused ATPase/permease subunit
VVRASRRCSISVARFYDPDGGRVLVDGRDLREYDLSAYLRTLAIVDQQPFLFNTTIRENIRLGRPDASEEEILQAAKDALVDDFVSELDDGYDTLCGERGNELSGGQLQRITIARALLRNPRILLLDEATSALDTESERIVQAALDRLKEGRTVLYIAHRMSTRARRRLHLCPQHWSPGRAGPPFRRASWLAKTAHIAAW